ncbi:TD and POZ domain-containing protein 4 [Araneus ventricosus]|uniref:TD and POZ domain-containing protein 4 n=1 Tax=Araneus ventricosus TaxID=182803 RepID=A0A4Y2IZF7_ARAVE|nr:TD and POZ domain-containing protein 4 [Araneus ventricosus]
MNKTRWCLQIRPKYINGAYVEYYLARETDKSGLRIIRVAFELSFLDSYGIQLVKKMQEASIKKDEFKGFAEFVEQAVVFTHRKYEYLPENTLTACCRMKRIGEQPQESVFCSANSVLGVEQSSFYWNIRDFSKIRPGVLRSIRKRNPYVKVELSLTAKPEEALQFEISHAHLHKPNMIDCKISVINAFEETAYSKKGSKYSKGKVWEFPIFVKKSQLNSEKNVCLQNDVLVLKCDISVSLGVISSFINGYRSPSLDGETSSSSENEDCSSTASGIISKLRKEVCSLQKALKREENGEETKTNEILVEFPHEDSSSLVNEKSSPDQNEESYSFEDDTIGEFENIKRCQDPSFEDEAAYSNKNEDSSATASEIIPEIRQEIKNLKKEQKEMENDEEIKRKEILQEFSHDDSPSSVNESTSPDQKEESYSVKVESVDEIVSKSFSIEEMLSGGSMKDEIKRFYQNGTFSDINLTVGKVTFPGHKLILSLKSRKFKEIFMNDFSKRSITLSDLDPETLRDLLDFVYTNNVENMTWEKAKKLFLAAERYQMTSLKHICLMFVKENINESNSCNILVFADEQQDEDLKKLALEFIVSQGKTIMNTEAWDEFTEKHFKLAFETMQKMYMNKTEK